MAEAEFVPVVEADAAEVADAVSVETEPVGLPSAPMMMGMRPSLWGARFLIMRLSSTWSRGE